MNIQARFQDEVDGPTLELERVAWRSLDASEGSVLSLSSVAHDLALVGDWGPLFRTLVGDAEIVRGSARIANLELPDALRHGAVGVALCDPPLPGFLSAADYLGHAARLSHGSAAQAALDAKRALERFGLHELARKKLSELALPQRRALGIALAALTQPKVACLEAPLRGLDAPSAEYVAVRCREAQAQARVIVSADALGAAGVERSLLEHADELFVLERGRLVARGTPAQVFAPSRRYVLRVGGRERAPFAASLVAAGCQLGEPQSGTYVVELPVQGTSDLLLDAALEHGMVVVELQPVLDWASSL